MNSSNEGLTPIRVVTKQSDIDFCNQYPTTNNLTEKEFIDIVANDYIFTLDRVYHNGYDEDQLYDRFLDIIDNIKFEDIKCLEDIEDIKCIDDIDNIKCNNYHINILSQIVHEFHSDENGIDWNLLSDAEFEYSDMLSCTKDLAGYEEFVDIYDATMTYIYASETEDIVIKINQVKDFLEAEWLKEVSKVEKTAPLKVISTASLDEWYVS